jgi:hypothetical protein
MILLVTIVSPEVSLADYQRCYFVIRTLSAVSLAYIALHALKNHVGTDRVAIASAMGFILLAIEQYSQLIWVTDRSYFALFGGLTFRLVGLAVFIYISYEAFFAKIDEED